MRQSTHLHMADRTDWDALEEHSFACPLCLEPNPLYYHPNEERYLLLGFSCGGCDAPYTDLFSPSKAH